MSDLFAPEVKYYDRKTGQIYYCASCEVAIPLTQKARGLCVDCEPKVEPEDDDEVINN